jgi:glucose-6-phosphate 1-dehydrogenase
MEARPDRRAAVLVIFGASGDLSRKKLLPALVRLHRKQERPRETQIVGFAKPSHDDESFRQLVNKALMESEALSMPGDESLWNELAPRLHYVTGDLEDGRSFAELDHRVESLGGGESNRVYYLAIPPNLYQTTIAHLGEAGMAREISGGGYRRIVIEKPFGRSGETAEALNQALLSVFDESQVFRIDHFLGKETAQNILFFRFANTVFEPVWNRNYVDHVQLSVLESVDVGERAGFYESNGVLRDMFQNHLLQLVTLMAMEAPGSFDANAIRNEKAKVLAAIPSIEGDRIATDVVRAQYEGYRETEGVDPRSTTATYAALKLEIQNWRWQGVPFYLRSGKALQERFSEILVHFRRPPHLMFPFGAPARLGANDLSICIEPDEGMHLRFEAKVPDTVADLRPVHMEFHYADDFPRIEIPDAYERLLLDVMEGDSTLFARRDGIALAWRILDPILERWDAKSAGNAAPPLDLYPRGSLGPASADDLLGRDGRVWARGCGGHRDPGHR